MSKLQIRRIRRSKNQQQSATSHFSKRLRRLHDADANAANPLSFSEKRVTGPSRLSVLLELVAAGFIGVDFSRRVMWLTRTGQIRAAALAA